MRNQHNLKKKKNNWKSREVKIVAGIGMFAVGIVTAVCLTKGKNIRKALQIANNTIENNSKEFSKRIGDLKAEHNIQISDFITIPENFKKLKDKYVQEFSQDILTPKLSYDPLKIPETQSINWIDSLLTYTDIDAIPALLKTTTLSSVIDTKVLRGKFANSGVVNVSLPVTDLTKPVISKNASIQGKPIRNIGIPVETDFKLAYGARVNWSEEKIARDIVQNFYDGHGHTLDGTQFLVEKLLNGRFKIKISGLATFDYENLQYLGSGNKVADLANAGGFGEGAKILAANLIGKGDAKFVKYGCADWELTFDGMNGVMRRMLNKVDSPLRGNFVEFETSNPKLPDAILDSINYFKHSKNPDFSDFTIETPDFAFKFLGEEKGNIYLTQRFEYAKAGQWDNGVDSLTLAYNKKPDEKQYKLITGIDIPKDRDRTFLSDDDIFNLTQYYASSMSKEQLLQTIISTKPLWGNISKDNKPSLYNFLKGVVTACRKKTSV